MNIKIHINILQLYFLINIHKILHRYSKFEKFSKLELARGLAGIEPATCRLRSHCFTNSPIPEPDLVESVKYTIYQLSIFFTLKEVRLTYWIFWLHIRNQHKFLHLDIKFEKKKNLHLDFPSGLQPEYYPNYSFKQIISLHLIKPFYTIFNQTNNQNQVHTY